MTFVYALVPAGWCVALVLVVRDRIAQRTPTPVGRHKQSSIESRLS